VVPAPHEQYPSAVCIATQDNGKELCLYLRIRNIGRSPALVTRVALIDLTNREWASHEVPLPLPANTAVNVKSPVNITASVEELPEDFLLVTFFRDLQGRLFITHSAAERITNKHHRLKLQTYRMQKAEWVEHEHYFALPKSLENEIKYIRRLRRGETDQPVVSQSKARTRAAFLKQKRIYSRIYCIAAILFGFLLTRDITNIITSGAAETIADALIDVLFFVVAVIAFWAVRRVKV
jgi:hypothetical protein